MAARSCTGTWGFAWASLASAHADHRRVSLHLAVVGPVRPRGVFMPHTPLTSLEPFHLFAGCPILFCISPAQVSTTMQVLQQKYSESGQNGEVNSFSKGALRLNYMHYKTKNCNTLLKLVNKKLDGDAGTESGCIGAPSESAHLASSEKPTASNTASRSTAAAKRASRENRTTFAFTARSSLFMADSSRRRTAALTVKKLTDALVANRAAGCDSSVVRVLETQLMDAVENCGSKRSRMDGARKQERSGAGPSIDGSGETGGGDADHGHSS